MSNDHECIDAQYQSLSILGQCCQGYGSVELAKHKQSQKIVVIKRINLDTLKDEVELVEVIHFTPPTT